MPRLPQRHFNPRSPWGERPSQSGVIGMPNKISIHAPRGGSDSQAGAAGTKAAAFQSTLPVGGATALVVPGKDVRPISIHAPRGGSDPRRCAAILPALISIHAPRGGSDDDLMFGVLFCIEFQSTLPVGGATARQLADNLKAQISIHAPRGGSDAGIVFRRFPAGRFQSTLPVGGATAKMHSFTCVSLAKR